AGRAGPPRRGRLRGVHLRERGRHAHGRPSRLLHRHRGGGRGRRASRGGAVKGSLYRPEDTIPARIGAIGDPGAEPVLVTFEPYPETCHRGVVHAGVLVLLADMAAGWLADRCAGDDWVFTSDLSLRAPHLRIPKCIEATAQPLRVGRGTTTAEVVMRDQTGELFAYGHSEFMRMAARPGDPPKPTMDDRKFRERRRQPLDRPLV